MQNLEEQLTNLSRSNGSKQYDANVDLIINDLKKKHNQEIANLQDQYKSTLDQIKSKVCCTKFCSIKIKFYFIQYNIYIYKYFIIGPSLYIVNK